MKSELTINSTYQEIFERISKLSTPLICDALPNVRMMDTNITSIGKKAQCIGRAYTVNSEQDSLAIMQALDDLQPFLEQLNCLEHDVVPIILTVASYEAPHALIGGMCTTVAEYKGFGGIISDGYCRDLNEIEISRLPVFAKGKFAKSGLKSRLGEIKVNILCGGVQVKPGEIIFADSDGILVMNKQEAISATLKAEEIKMKETDTLQKIQAGAQFKQICNLDDHIDNLKNGKASKLELI